MATINEWETYKNTNEERIAMLEFELEKARAIVGACETQISIIQNPEM